MRTFAAFLAVAVLGIAQAAQAQPGCIKDRYGNVQCAPAGGHCLKDYAGDVKCSPADGGILLDRYRVPVCGPGKCLKDRNGDVVCASVPKGSAALNAYGDPVCTEGCVRAAAQACVTPTK
jgi:hypothetical protein